jgi:orotidine-5'-phosphate decarboxylase
MVLALDFPFQKAENLENLFTRTGNLLEQVHPYFCAVKINHHLVLPLGISNRIEEIVDKIHDKGLLAIMDCKINDIGATNQLIAEYYFDAGFDALTANPFVGWDEGLQPIFEVANKLNKGVILLVYMSHKGSEEGYGQIIIDRRSGKRTFQYVSFAKKALEYHADGVVVGATYPEKIQEIHEILGSKIPIYSPGIGAQGGTIQTALRAGATYPIIGREITSAKNPVDEAKKNSEIVNAIIRAGFKDAVKS